MPLPTQAQVNTAGRYAGAVIGTAFTIFGLQAKGISLDQVNALINALGTVVNDAVIVIGMLMPLYVTFKGIVSSSSNGQAAAIGANPKALVNAAPNGKAIITITDPAMATAALEGQRKAS
jgi:hypothetical protein